MHDKVLGFLRETMLHENEIEELSIDLAANRAQFRLLQPHEYSSWPDRKLVLTFLDVHEVAARSIGDVGSRFMELLGMNCSPVEEGGYRVEITTGERGEVRWSIVLKFGDLRFQRS